MLSIYVEVGTVTVIIDNTAKHAFDLRTYLDHIHAYRPTAASWQRVLRYMNEYGITTTLSNTMICLTPAQ